MLLSQCKICNNHICILKDKVLCGYPIDRLELPVRSENTGDKSVEGCPKEQEKKATKVKQAGDKE